MEHMKKIFVGLFILLFSANVLAGELSQYSGPYIGIYMGYAKGDLKGNENFNDPNGPNVQNNISVYNNSLSKSLWGGLVGYNKIVSSNYLLGFEADYEQRNAQARSDFIDPTLSIANGNGQVETKIRGASSVRLRVGRIFNNDKTLAYLTAGYGMANIKSNFALNDNGAVSVISKSDWNGGFTGGFGLEHFVNDSLSVRTEYRYSDYGKTNNVDVGTFSPNLSGFNEHIKYENENSVRFGLMYHF